MAAPPASGDRRLSPQRDRSHRQDRFVIESIQALPSPRPSLPLPPGPRASSPAPPLPPAQSPGPRPHRPARPPRTLALVPPSPTRHHVSPSSPLTLRPPQIDADKRFVVAQAGITLNALHAALAAHGLAMINLGSISDQSLAGVVTTATHGTGIAHPVLSMYVRALSLLLADGSRVRCSRECDPDLFMASICGLGSTGLILDITLEVQPAFRLIERQESRPFDDFLENMRSLVHADKFVRFWWFPQADTVRVSSFHETTEVRPSPSPSPSSSASVFSSVAEAIPQPRKPLNSWLWHSLVGFHLLQLVLFLGRYLSVFNTWYVQISSWLISPPTVAVDDSWRIFYLDCKVGPPVLPRSLVAICAC